MFFNKARRIKELEKMIIENDIKLFNKDIDIRFLKDEMLEKQNTLQQSVDSLFVRIGKTKELPGWAVIDKKGILFVSRTKPVDCQIYAGEDRTAYAEDCQIVKCVVSVVEEPKAPKTNVKKIRS